MQYFSIGLLISLYHRGHLQMTILGAMEVSAYGDLANWMIPVSQVLGGKVSVHLWSSGIIYRLAKTTGLYIRWCGE